MRYRIALLLVLPFVLVVPAAAEQHIRVKDEWEAIRRVVVSNEAPNRVSPLVVKIVREAQGAGIEVIVSDGGAVSQAKIQKQLTDAGAIKDPSKVSMVDNPLGTDWARDRAPIAVHEDGKATYKSLAGGRLTKAEADTSSERIAKETGAKAGSVPDVTFPPGSDPPSLPLSLDGGDFMTTDGGRTLVTSESVYDDNGEGNGANDTDVRTAVDKALRDGFGINKVVEIEGLDRTATDGAGRNYALSNEHVDLQVRTLPGKKVIVADVPAGDPQKPILDRNAKRLEDAGYTVIRVMNAAQEAAGNLIFFSYTNALFLNNTILIPSYGDPEKDRAAKEAYEKALPGYKVVPIDSRRAVKEGCGALRCSGHELSAAPLRSGGPNASALGDARLSFDASTGILNFGSSTVTFLGDPGDEETNERYAGDPLLGAFLAVTGLAYQSLMTGLDDFTFVDGSLSVVSADGTTLLSAALPAFTFFGDASEGQLAMSGTITDVLLADPLDSLWADDFLASVRESTLRLPTFFADDVDDLLGATSRFTQSVDGYSVGGVGLTGGQIAPVPVPPAGLLLLSGMIIAFGRRSTVRN